MVKKVILFFKKIFTNKFLAVFLIILLYLLSRIKINPLLSDWFIDIITIYLLIYFFLPLFNFFKKDSFLLNGLIFIVGFLFLIEILKILPDKNRFIYNLIAIFFLSFIASFITSFIFKIFLFFSKRKTLLKLLLSFIFLLITLFLFYPPKIIWEKSVEFYYQKINKKAGIIFYEKEYQKLLKEDLDLRKRIEDIINHFEKETNFGIIKKTYW